MVPRLAPSPQTAGGQVGEHLPDDLSTHHQHPSAGQQSTVNTYLPERSSVDRSHLVFRAEVNVVEVDGVPGDADSLCEVVVLV